MTVEETQETHTAFTLSQVARLGARDGLHLSLRNLLLLHKDSDTDELIGGGGRQRSRGKAPVPGMRSSGGETGRHTSDLVSLPAGDLADLIHQLTDQMHAAAAELQFELAARLRDEVAELKKELRQMRRASGA